MSTPHPADYAAYILLQRAEREWDFEHDRPNYRMDPMYESAMRQAIQEYGRLAPADQEAHQAKPA